MHGRLKKKKNPTTDQESAIQEANKVIFLSKPFQQFPYYYLFIYFNATVTKNGKKTFYLCQKKSLVCKVAAASHRYTNEEKPGNGLLVFFFLSFF